MYKIMFIFMMLTVSTVIADDAVSTTPEMCSNGTGTIVIGAVTGHKYCKSNQRMNWWNAYAWCDHKEDNCLIWIAVCVQG